MFARHKGPLDAGRTEIALLFFGKALRDQGVPPPYHVGQLRGGRHVLGQDPDFESMALEPWTYTTKAQFSLDDLSDAEWDSDHKQNMIEFLEQHGTKPVGEEPE